MEHEKQITTFIDSARHYFEYLGKGSDTVDIGAPYLIKNDQQIGLDFTSVIAVNGSAKGFVFFTASKVLLRYLLLRQSEPNSGKEYLRDMVGEVANSIAGNVRRNLGSNFEISPPKTLNSKITNKHLSAASRSYVIPIKWNNNMSQLVVSITYQEA